MPEGLRSPFGILLRAYRQKRGLSQSGLADLIVERNARNPDFAKLGLISEKTIANLESLRRNGAGFVRPRPATVRLLATALDIPGGSDEESRFFATAEETRNAARKISGRTTSVSSPTFIREGREDLLQKVEEATASAFAGTPTLLLLAGDAGTGKTHIIHEICRTSRQQSDHVSIAWGECTSGAGSAEPYLPFVQAFNHILGLSGQTRDAEVLAQQHEHISDLLTIAPDLIGTFVDEAALVAQATHLVEEHPDLSGKLHSALRVRGRADAAVRFDQIVRFLTAVTSSMPVVLVLEDLHWADDRTCALLLHLQRRFKDVASVPLLIIGSYRPSDLTQADPSTRHALDSVVNEVGRHVGDAVLDLSSTIGTQHGRAFVASLLHHLPISTTEELETFLYDRTEGHPLFAVELLRWLRETERLKPGADGRWSLTTSAINGYAPSKVRSVIRERIERLPTHLRRILEVASVQGNVFMFDVLMATGSVSVESFPEVIDDQLVRRYRLLSPRQPSTINGRRLHMYSFAHALFQEYVYDSLSPRDREHLHAATARAAVEVIGSGHHAASGEISIHFEHAHLYGDSATHAYAAGGHALNQLDYDVSQEWFERARAFAEKAGDLDGGNRARNGLIAALRGLGELDQGIELARDVLISARLQGSRSIEAESENLLGQILYDKGQISTAVGHLERAVELLRDMACYEEMSGIEAMLSHSFYALGAYDKALAHAREAYRTAREAGNDAFAGEALLAAGNCEVDLGRYDSARETYRNARVIYDRAEEPRGIALTLINTALCHIESGHYNKALEILNITREETTAIRTPRLEGAAYFYSGLAHEGNNDLGAAEHAYSTSLDSRRRVGLNGAVIDSLAGLLRVAVSTRNDNDITSRLTEIQEWIRDHQGEGLENPFAVYLSLAKAHCYLGNVEESVEAISAGYALLMTRAERISDDEARHSYLHVVPSNRALAEWHERLQE